MMRNMTNDQKSKLYNSLLFTFERLQEQVRQIKSKNFDLSPEDEKKVLFLESRMRQVYNQTRSLYN